VFRLKNKKLIMKLRFGNLLIVFILALCLIFSLSACATPEEEDPSGEEIPQAGGVDGKADATTGTEIPAADLSNAETAATYLKSTYFTSFRKKG
jgi:hypothetical protein